MELWRAANSARRRPAGAVRASRVRERIDGADLLLLARYGDRPGGMLLAEQFLDGVPDPSAAHIAMVFVHPALWGCGIGTALLRALQAGSWTQSSELDHDGEPAPGRDWTQLSAWFRDDNRRAQRLFAGAGFADTGHRAHLQDGDVIQQWRWTAGAGQDPRRTARRESSAPRPTAR